MQGRMVPVTNRAGEVVLVWKIASVPEKRMKVHNGRQIEAIGTGGRVCG